MKPAIPAWAAPALVALFVLAVVTASASKSATFDESVHIFSGWRVLTQGDYATNHEHPPLMKVLAAAPLALMSLRPPGSEMRKEIDEWSVSHDFVYHANDGDRILAAARFPIALTAALLAWCLYRWAAAALGATVALVALALLVTEPNLLAHAGLVTTDMGMTATTFLTVAAFTRWLRTRSSAWMAAAGVSLGRAFLAKFTAV
ncbi:MAG TPA: glycosyltransferase family 39 protein, partial [Candidatus Polarisedimenticolia bacterium]|nr:glycosyltransferase family 39 protein [Candidatus Polarisedimenticolia bacterium]